MKLYRVGVKFRVHGHVLIEAENEERALAMASGKTHRLGDVDVEESDFHPMDVYGAYFVKDLPEETE